MHKTILLVLLLFCVVMLLCGADGSGCGSDPDVDTIPVCDSDLTPQECEDAIEVMPKG